MNFLLAKVPIFFQLILLISFTSNAHEGHSHSSSPSTTSRSSFKSSIDSESPFTPALKIRSGYEFGQYAGALPGFNSFFGNEEISLNTNYEFQFREFSANQNAQQESDFIDRDYDNHLTAVIKKSLSNQFSFLTTAEYETSQAVRLARSINDFNYFSITPSLSYNFSEDWQFAANYLFSQRQYPNGTYLVPVASPTGKGEPISPNEEPKIASPITREGIVDVQNQVSVVVNGNFYNTSLQIEGKYLTNNSDLETRIYNAQGLKVGFERPIWNRLFCQLSHSIENRIFAERTDQINVTEFGLQQELSARLSVSGIARMNQFQTVKNTSYTEGYAQVQYVF